MAKRGPSEHYVLNTEQVRLLVSSAHDLKERVCIGLLLYAGLRVGELVHFRQSWISGNKEIRIPSAMWCACDACGKAGGEWTPKTKAGARIIPITDRIRADVLAFAREYPDGLQVSRFVARNLVKRVMKRSGLKIAQLGGGTGFPHMLRATCATMLAGTLNEAQLCYVMGWTDLVTAQKYVRLSAARTNAVQAMEQAFK